MGMSNILIAHSGLMDDAIYTASAEAVGFPVSNVGNIQPSKTWHSTTKSYAAIDIDLGEVKTFNFITALRTNLVNHSITFISVSTSDTFEGLESPDYTSGVVRALPDGLINNYNYTNVYHLLPADQSNRWVRIAMYASNNIDDYIEVGRALVSKAFIPNINIGYGWGIGVEDLTKPTQSIGGSSYPNPLPKTRILKYSLDFNNEDEMYENAHVTDRLHGTSKEIFVHRDLDNVSRYMDYSIYGLQQSLQPIINNSYGLFSQRYLVRELL